MEIYRVQVWEEGANNGIHYTFDTLEHATDFADNVMPQRFNYVDITILKLTPLKSNGYFVGLETCYHRFLEPTYNEKKPCQI